MRYFAICSVRAPVPFVATRAVQLGTFGPCVCTSDLVALTHPGFGRHNPNAGALQIEQATQNRPRSGKAQDVLEEEERDDEQPIATVTVPATENATVLVVGDFALGMLGTEVSVCWGLRSTSGPRTMQDFTVLLVAFSLRHHQVCSERDCTASDVSCKEREADSPRNEGRAPQQFQEG